MACTRFQWRQLHYKEVVESCLSCRQHVYWSSSLFQPNIIKICLRVSKLWSTQGCISDFYFRGDNYITNKASVVSLVRDTTAGPPLHSYQILSNYLKQYKSYGLHYFGFRGDNYIMKKLTVVSLACDMPTGPPPHSNQILSKHV